MSTPPPTYGRADDPNLPTRAAFFAALEALSPTRLAEPWDNVGLLVESPSMVPQVAAALVTIDLTDAVLSEAAQLGVDVIVAYHPPIFSGLKRITSATPTGRRLQWLLQGMVSVWSPHTALDAVPGGMNDWLASGLGELAASAPLQPCGAAPDQADTGLGRAVTLREGATLATLVRRLKAHLGLPHLRVATAGDPGPYADDTPVAVRDEADVITRVVVCPGAGGSLFDPLPPPHAGGPELYVTGEWGHHHVLAKAAEGARVILTDHSNTERGFLPTYAQWIRDAAPGVQVHVSQVDTDPLSVW